MVPDVLTFRVLVATQIIWKYQTTMPRPGQAAARRQRKESVASGQANGHSDDHSATAPEGGAQVLPVAQLPDDFEGEPLDGATYLALVG